MKKEKNCTNMGDLLALRMKSNVEVLRCTVPRPAPGIPLNSLPGWEEVPLYLKLPMLNCPSNQIVFTRSKIGHGLLKFKSNFDTSMTDRNDYNQLHDPHLKNFYERERNLEVLKKLGEITDDNYVICTLRDFNEYRRGLNRFHLFEIYKEFFRMEEEHEDRVKINHAERMSKLDRKRTKDAQDNFRDPEDIKRNRIKLRQQKTEKSIANWTEVLVRIERIQKLKELKQILLKQKIILHCTAIEQRRIVADDVLRNRMIAAKKLIKMKNDRSKRHLKSFVANRKKLKLEKQIQGWEAIFVARTKRHIKNTKLIEKSAKIMQTNIQRHLIKTEKTWNKIRVAIAKRADKRKKEKLGINCIVKKLYREYKSLEPSGSLSHMTQCASQPFSVYRLDQNDIKDAVLVAVDLQESVPIKQHVENIQISKTDSQDNIYQAAKYIINHILNIVKTDLMSDEVLFESVYQRIDRTFDYIKTGIIKKVAQLLTDVKDEGKGIKIRRSRSHSQLDTEATKSFLSIKGPFESAEKLVQFKSYTPVIGKSSIHDDLGSITKFKSVRSRTPTPTGSFTSVLALFGIDENNRIKLLKDSYHSTFEHSRRDEQIYVEYFLVKFKRKLSVGVGKKVFEALQLYKMGKTFGFNKELLCVDRKYLIKTVAKSILQNSVSYYEFKSALKLCISAISADVIWELQNTFMKSSRDTRNMKIPRSRCKCGAKLENCILNLR